MSQSNYTIKLNARINTSTVMAIGQFAVPEVGTGLWLPATTANRGTRRSSMIALNAASSANPGFVGQGVGDVPREVSGLAAGTASWVRVSSTGYAERCTPASGDDIVGWCEADGLLHLACATLTAEMTSGGATSTTNSTLTQTTTEAETTGATPTTIGDTFALPTNSIVTVDVQAACISAGAGGAKVFNVRRQMLNIAGTVSSLTQSTLTGPDSVGAALTSTVAIDYTGTTGRVEVVGDGTLRWRVDRQIVSLTAAAAPPAPAPSLISISPTSGQELTAVPLTLTGTDFVSGCTVTVGGVAATSVVFVDSTEVTCTTAATLDFADSPFDVTITNPDTQSDTLANGYAVTDTPAGVDPASLTLSLYQKDYGGVPWAGTASAGTSGSRTLVAGVAPAVGANFGTHPSADYDGVNDYTILDAAETLTEIIDTAAWYFGFVVELDSYGADAVGAEYNQRALVCESGGGNFGVTTSASGLQAFQYGAVDGKIVTPYVALPATGTKCFLEAWYDGTSLFVAVDGNLSVAAAVDPMVAGVLASTASFSTNYDGTAFIEGRVALKLASKTVPATLDRAGLLTWAQAEYAVP
jgi:hypothetical protein